MTKISQAYARCYQYSTTVMDLSGRKIRVRLYHRMDLEDSVMRSLYLGWLNIKLWPLVLFGIITNNRRK